MATPRTNDRARLLRLYRNILLSDNIPCRIVKSPYIGKSMLYVYQDEQERVVETIYDVIRLLSINHGYNLVELD